MSVLNSRSERGAISVRSDIVGKHSFCGRGVSEATQADGELCGFCASFGEDAFENSAWCLHTQSIHGCHRCRDTSCTTIDVWCPLFEIPDGDTRPRPFYNAMRRRAGGGSCWMNAALQALFAPTAVKWVLKQLWREMPSERRKRFVNMFRSAEPEFSIDPGWDYEHLLAATYRACFVGEVDAPLACALFDEAFYKLRQEDSDEFLRRVLEGRALLNIGSPVLVRSISGLVQQSLRCTNGDCVGEIPSVLENLPWIALPVHTEQGAPITCIQDAVNAYRWESKVDDLINVCPVCGRGGENDRRTWIKTSRVEEYPAVLTLVLNRWNNPYGASLHTVTAGNGSRCKEPKEARMCELDGRCGRTNCVAARWMLKRRSTAPRWPRRGPTRPPRWPKTGPRRPQDGPRQPVASATNRGEETLQKK